MNMSHDERRGFSPKQPTTIPNPGAPVGPAPVPYARGSETSRAAAERLAPRYGSIKRRVLDAIAVRPMACYEVEFALNLRHETAASALWSLRKDGWLVLSGETRVRPLTGNECEIYRQATEAERAALLKADPDLFGAPLDARGRTAARLRQVLAACDALVAALHERDGALGEHTLRVNAALKQYEETVARVRVRL